ncbi:MAG: TonB-dependent receptor [Bacteroidetes bacterium]|nr:TonB-dependent receptor [Bacteroidota bacterium]
MSRPNFGVLLLFLGLSSPGYTQTLVVTDASTSKPISQVTVSSFEPVINVTTNDSGLADLSGFEKAKKITIRHLGYFTLTKSYRELESASFLVRMEINPFQIDEVVVSANRIGSIQSETPRQTLILGEMEIEFRNAQTSADVLQNSGDVFVQKSQAGGGSPVLRGFEANKILMVVDGIRMNNAVYRSGHLQNIITVDPASLEKLEVLQGPGSVTFGSDALGGVIQFFTRRPVLSENGEFKVNTDAFTRYSSVNQEKTIHGSVNIGIENVAFLTSVTRSDFGDLKQGANRNPFYGSWGKRTFYSERIGGKDSAVVNSDPNLQKPTGYTQWDFMEKILFRQDENLNHHLNIQYSTSTDIPRYDRLTETGSNGKPKSAEWYYGPQKRFLAAYTADLTAKTSLFESSKLILGYQSIEESRHTRNFGSSKLNHRIENITVLSANLDFGKSINQHLLSYGFEGSLNKVSSKANQENISTGVKIPLDTRYPDGGSDMTTVAGYLTDTWKLAPDLIFSGGLRASYVSLNADFNDTSFFPFPFSSVSQSSGAVNGNAGIVWLPVSDWKFSLSASSGFRAPNVDDVGKLFESVPGSVIVPNPDLKPEYTYTGEAGISGFVGEGIKVETTGFYTLYREAITTEPALFNGKDSILYDGMLSRVSSQTNANKGFIYGFSAYFSAGLSDGFLFSSSLTYTYGRLETRSKTFPLDHVPPVYGRTGVSYSTGSLRSEFFALYNGWKHLKDYNPNGEDNLQYATEKGNPAWFTLNLRVSWQTTDHFRIQTSLENILDQNYRVFASGISAPGRNFSLTLRGEF